MEMQTTSSFAKAFEAYQQAVAQASLDDDCSVETQRERDAEYYERQARLMLLQAETPGELKTKLDLVFEKELYDWRSWADFKAAIDSDFARMARPEPSRAMRAAFESWRSAYVTLEKSIADAESRSRLLKERGVQFRSLLQATCVTPGDFLVKAYAELLTSSPSTFHNCFDPDTSDFDDQTDDGDAYKRSVYADLDQTDLGACLLTFGRIHFNPTLWLDRAGRIGLPVLIDRAENASPSLRVYPAPQNEPRAAREQERLIRMISFDTRRVNQIVDAIESGSSPCAVPPTAQAA